MHLTILTKVKPPYSVSETGHTSVFCLYLVNNWNYFGQDQLYILFILLNRGMLSKHFYVAIYLNTVDKSIQIKIIKIK